MTEALSSAIVPAPLVRARRVTQVAGALLILFGVLVIAGWLFHLPVLLQIRPSRFAMVIGTAVCFVLAGVALLVTGRPSTARWHTQTVLGGVIILIAAAMLFQQLTRIDLGIDLAALHAWLADPNPTPGRMASNTALAFILAGMALMLMRYSGSRTAVRLIEVSAFLVVFIGLTGFLGYFLKLEFLYSWFQYTHMALSTATGILVLGVGLWSAWLQLPTALRSMQNPTQNRILWVSASLFFTIALVAGLVGFASIQKRTEKTLEDGLRRTLHNRIDLFTTAVNETSMATQLIATRPSVQRYLHLLNNDPGNAKGAKELASAATGFLSLGFSAVVFHDKRGHELARAGKFVAAPEMAVSLPSLHPTQLIWHKGFLLETRMPVSNDAGQLLGTVHLLRPLDVLTRMVRDTSGLGETGEMGICASTDKNSMRCFPQRLNPRASEFPYQIDGRQLPMSYALDGGNGVITTLDYRRQNVTAAYAPIGQLGLGMVLKTDTAELYRPIGEQLRWSLLLLLALIAGGMGILHLLVTPLLRRLANSEEKYRAVAESAHDAIVTVNVHGEIVYWNRAAETIFGHSETQILGRPLTTLMPERYRVPHQQGWDRLQKTNQPRLLWTTVELPGLHQDGTEFPLELSLSRWHNRGEQFFTGHMRDVSRRKQAEQAARRLANIVESSNDAIVSQSLEEMVTSWNAAAERLYGYSAAEIIGQSGRVLLPPDKVSEEQDFLDRLRRGERIVRHQTIRLHKDGSPVEVALTVSVLRGASGKVEGTSIIARDLNERSASRHRAQRETLQGNSD